MAKRKPETTKQKDKTPADTKQPSGATGDADGLPPPPKRKRKKPN